MCVFIFIPSSHPLSSSDFEVFGSALFPPTLRAQAFTPPFVLRAGFGAIFAGAGYVLASGDSRNGSGIVTGSDAPEYILQLPPTVDISLQLGH